MGQIEKISVGNFKLKNKREVSLTISYELFGRPLYTAPVVMVNHALTGNSSVAEENGWWNQIVGQKKTIDTEKYTVICFNIPGNGYDKTYISNYQDFTTEDVSKLFLVGLQQLKIHKLFAIIGGSLGGSIAWNMAVLNPEITENIIPIACHWKASDWVLANCHIQDLILNHSSRPLEDARNHAMLIYRTPQSLTYKFRREKNPDSDSFKIVSWLEHHGTKLKNRFDLRSYKLMNHLLKTIDVSENPEELNVIKARIHIIAIDSDYLFTAADSKETFDKLSQTKKDVFYHEIKSIHRHDAFLIEYEQMVKFLTPIFSKTL